MLLVCLATSGTEQRQYMLYYPSHPEDQRFLAKFNVTVMAITSVYELLSSSTVEVPLEASVGVTFERKQKGEEPLD